MTDDSHDRSIRARQTVRIVLWVVLAAVVIALALSNTQDVTVDWLFGNVDTSLWVVIVAATAVGALLGYLARWRRD
ncbi:MAG TPA: LapA family protein [Ilumatobacteraceae bacterium]|nr:LapA family protein [Ilumatobacteraceae bacterium]